MTDAHETTVVRRHEGTETTFERADSPFIDDLEDVRDPAGGLTGTVEYDLIAHGAGGDDSRSEQVEVQCAAEPPDLVVDDIFNSGVTVANVGAGPAGPFIVLINDELFESDGLESGESEQFDIDLCEGQVDVFVDPRNAVPEADENNNEESTTIIC